jgi:hypothetical protein
MVWQHNFAEWEKPDGATDVQKERALRIERAFLIGAAAMAAQGFSLPQADETLFLMNVLGTYKGLGPDEAEDELSQMFEQISEASGAEENATKVGGVLMIEYLVNGKVDKHNVHPAALQKECWG